MANRPAFIPNTKKLGVEIKNIEFKWHSGMSIQQKQRSISEMHQCIKNMGFSEILEISTKSRDNIGVALSAFNLKTKSRNNGIEFTVETAFQSSKVFENGGPYKELLCEDSRTAKKDQRIRNSGNLLAFNFFGTIFPIRPQTYFYDWLYINTLLKNIDLAKQIINYEVFTDIEFNPEKSINCQAFSAALYVSAIKNSIEVDKFKNNEMYLDIMQDVYLNQQIIYQKELI